MTRRTLIVSRRTALQLGALAAWSLGSLALAPAYPSAMAAPAASAKGAGSRPAAPRFRFDCVTRVRGFSPLHRLEEVWADPRYLTVTDCVVRYVGPPPFILTAEESAIVGVAEAAGAVVADRQATYLLILAASTRIDPARLDAKLAELGRPVVEASLALAPEAPQAAAFAAWLQSTA
jgi:hypothetical protein